MVFNSYLFIFAFLPVTIFGYYFLNHFEKYKLGMLFLSVMSLLFYAYHDYRYLFLLVGSVIINYFLAKMILKSKNHITSKGFLVIAIFVNLSVLFYYKYFGFFIATIKEAFHSELFFPTIILPIGISFFTFQQIAYEVDCYRKEANQYSFLDYFTYVTFFPDIMSGPIALHSEIIPQLQNPINKTMNYDRMTKGIYAFSRGLAKKVLLADTFASLANYGYNNFVTLDATNTLLAMFFYTMQIYFDFSGYSDMVYGIGYFFNIEMPINFNSPYKAASIKEFWDRWHMSLTRFFTRYVYFPLGGNRKGTVRTYFNMFLIFLLSGLWHGANWTYIAWGMAHGFLSILYRAGRKYIDRIPRVMRVIGTFIFVMLAWNLFRSSSIKDAIYMFEQLLVGSYGTINSGYAEIMNEMIEIRVLARLGMGHWFDLYEWIPIVFLSVGVMFGTLKLRNTQEKTCQFSLDTRQLITSIVLMTWSILSFSNISEFLYSNF